MSCYTGKGTYITGERISAGEVGRLDKEILRELYIRYGRELYLYLYGLCRSREMAEDIRQETFYKALLSLEDGHRNVRAWLYMVGRNLMLNEMKRKRRETVTEAVGVLADAGWMREAGGQDPEAYAMSMAAGRNLWRALQTLDTRKREVLILNCIEQFSLKETARIMGITYENARVLSHRAKKEMRKVMEADDYEIS